jgi:hypothetical protein
MYIYIFVYTYVYIRRPYYHILQFQVSALSDYIHVNECIYTYEYAYNISIFLSIPVSSSCIERICECHRGAEYSRGEREGPGMHIYVHVYVHVYTHVHTHTYVHIYVDIWI